MRKQREEGREWRGEVKRRDVEVQQQERFERIQRSRNGWYKEIRVLGVPMYLREKGKEKRMIRIARFREREGRRCRICGWAEETWEHVMEVCMREKGVRGRERILEILDEDGRGEEWMKKLQRRRGEEGEGRRGETEDGWTRNKCEWEREEE